MKKHISSQFNRSLLAIVVVAVVALLAFQEYRANSETLQLAPPTHTRCLDDSDCGRGFICSSGFCARVLGPGSRCDASDGSNLCPNGYVCRENRCRLPPAEGEDCTENGRFLGCRSGSYCDPNTKKCERQLGPDSECKGYQDPTQTNWMCLPGLICYEDPITGKHTCREPLKEGENCGGTLLVQGQCDFGLICKEGKCVLAPGLGDPCRRIDRRHYCLEGTCVNGICQEELADPGEACLPGWGGPQGFECKRGVCLPNPVGPGSICLLSPVDGLCYRNKDCQDGLLCNIEGKCFDPNIAIGSIARSNTEA